MDQKSQSKGDIGGNLLSASLEELEPWVDWSLALSDAKMTNFYYKRPLVVYCKRWFYFILIDM